MYQNSSSSKALHSTVFCTIAALAAVIVLTAIPSLYWCSVSSTSVHILPNHFGIRQFHRTHIRGDNAAPEAVHLQGVKSKYAVATLLTDIPKDTDYSTNNYFIATRILAYQLLHDPDTRLKDHNVPFIVMVTQKIPEPARERLRKDGAIVVEAPLLHAKWLKPNIPEWADLMTKLRLWELVDFERILYLDADVVLAARLDDIFNDPAIKEQVTLDKSVSWPQNPAPVPKTYVFGGNAENTHNHQFPPSQDGRDWPNKAYLNAGFLVLRPDLDLLRYYISILHMPGSFDSSLCEQNLINAVHRVEGNMPWRQVNTSFNVHYPTMDDVRKGAKSVHAKWWHSDDQELKLWMVERKRRMVEFFATRDSQPEQRFTLWPNIANAW
ncbi:glycosyltransferase family 8 protein [Myriangium duriaei CBS 260.36]|uniref:Glycosyltransferase family 8 protein n=1 Tax=Myriangium duriaei CBS 260.36 TaxID=1168546 RepID=A0A9P4MRE9_9PEZI|nr:glycosyltransferase family 8 protein [Myriangium duriaei CBS 260.36]